MGFRLLLLIICFPLLSFAKDITKYVVYFSDKNVEGFSVLRPDDFLSSASIARRAEQNISVSLEDVPVTVAYIKQVEQLGAKVYGVSNWFNFIIISFDSDRVAELELLPFVEQVKYVGKSRLEPFDEIEEEGSLPSYYSKVGRYYGYGANQVSIMKSNYVHSVGYEGQGIMVGVMDGGFDNVHKMPFFDSLRADNRIVYTHDVVDNNAWVYESSSHGTEVLSTMGSDLPGFFVGTAAKASYALIRTEDVSSEHLIEEYNWAVGIERADSVGVDVLNSSLGYTTFDDKQMNHDYEFLNGLNSIATNAADLAHAKGMLVVNSAGNSGADRWKYIGVPADGRDVISVGAVTHSGGRVNFSSVGPTADGRIKPTLSAVGRSSIVASLHSCDVEMASGTSFASPILSGALAALWSAFPEKTNDEIYNVVLESGDRFVSPDNKFGHGIPDFAYAYFALYEPDFLEFYDDESVAIFPLFNKEKAQIIFIGLADDIEIKVSLKDQFGQEIFSENKFTEESIVMSFMLDEYKELAQGLYHLSITSGGQQYNRSILKQ